MKEFLIMLNSQFIGEAVFTEEIRDMVNIEKRDILFDFNYFVYTDLVKAKNKKDALRKEGIDEKISSAFEVLEINKESNSYIVYLKHEYMYATVPTFETIYGEIYDVKVKNISLSENIGLVLGNYKGTKKEITDKILEKYNINKDYLYLVPVKTKDYPIYLDSHFVDKKYKSYQKNEFGDVYLGKVNAANRAFAVENFISNSQELNPDMLKTMKVDNNNLVISKENLSLKAIQEVINELSFVRVTKNTALEVKKYIKANVWKEKPLKEIIYDYIDLKGFGLYKEKSYI